MARHSTETAHETDDEPTAASLTDRARGVAGTLTTGNRLGTAAMLAGGALLARAIRAERSTRTAVQGLAGAALVGLGLRQRLAGGASDEPETSDAGRTHDPDVSPRGTSDEPDVETVTEPDEGRVQFTEDQHDEPRSKPRGDESSGDPRVRSDDESVSVDLSEAAMADEASEATGPTPEQSQPAQTDATEPEGSPDEDVGTAHVDEDAAEAVEERGGPSADESASDEASENSDVERTTDPDAVDQAEVADAGPDVDELDEKLGDPDELTATDANEGETVLRDEDPGEELAGADGQADLAAAVEEGLDVDESADEADAVTPETDEDAGAEEEASARQEETDVEPGEDPSLDEPEAESTADRDASDRDEDDAGDGADADENPDAEDDDGTRTGAGEPMGDYEGDEDEH